MFAIMEQIISLWLFN